MATRCCTETEEIANQSEIDWFWSFDVWDERLFVDAEQRNSSVVDKDGVV